MAKPYLSHLIEFIQDAERPVTARVINYHFSIGESDDSGWPVTRSYIRDAIKLYATPMKICIGASGSGYFVIETAEQYHKYIVNLEGRIAGIKERIEFAKEAYNE